MRRFPVWLLLMMLPAASLGAAERNPQWWSFEFKGGVWLPANNAVENFTGCCEPTGTVEFGPLLRSKWGFELGVGFMDTEARAVGAGSGQVSGDRFNFLILPFHNSLVFRADFKENQLLVPYLKAGTDYLFFRENVQGSVTKGVKYGLHGAGGLQVLLEAIDEISQSMEGEVGVNDIYLTLEGRYAWIDSFGQSGLDLSNWTVAGGFLFEF